MKLLQRASPVAALALATLITNATAEDVLISKRQLSKRQLNPEGQYNMSFFHINDVHAHLDEFSSSGTDCTNPSRGCYGGYARVKSTIDDIRPTVGDSLFLNVGDEFQGTLFYTYYGGEKIAETLNQLQFDAMTLGNHEFDGGDDELGAFLENLTFPVVSANIQSTQPQLNATIRPYHIFEQYQLAVIGVTTDTTPQIANVGPLTSFEDPVEAVQRTVDYIRSTTNITRIAAITHIGYEEDQRLAQETAGLYLIMGGHSHTLLLPANDTDAEDAEGEYPTIVNNRDGEEVFVVTAYRWGEYLGYIDVLYDAEGRILEYRGAPIHLTNTTEQDPGLQAQIDAWRVPFEAFAAEELGQSNVILDQSTCQRQECLLGDFMADAMFAYRSNLSSEADFALINAGGIRATIDEGPITRGEVLTSFPFGNAIVEITLSGDDIWKVLEGIFTRVSQFNGRAVTSGVQLSQQIRVGYNPANSNGTKLVNVTIGGQPLDREAEYQVVTLDFLAGGGDNFFLPVTDFVTLDTQDEVLTQYILRQSPVDIALDGRIAVVNGTASNSTSNGTSSDTGVNNSTTDASEGNVGSGGASGSNSASIASGISVGAGMMLIVLTIIISLLA
ncbi:hypothetical protein LTR05_001431 [Lithohypha guttulata]|uniref:5'-nucleotidase n=1 Tax=Lithohypha guttulata TaxID=1690604 RepID=A0AAN7T7Y7_9EURO|nr:hypothetical protein LTR05_001431 [Lithohypha guttulata]